MMLKKLLCWAAIARVLVEPAVALAAQSGHRVAAFAPPAVLSVADVGVYRRAFELARGGQLGAANAQASSAGDPLLALHVTGEALVASNAGVRAPAAVAQWLESAADLPQAPALYAASGKQFKKPAELGNRWGQWRWSRGVRPATPAEKNISQLTWAHYSVGQLPQALARAAALRTSPTPEAGFALFVGGLAAWRQDDFATARSYFSESADKPGLQPDMQAAAHVWAARTAQQFGDVETASRHLQIAAATRDTFYGLLATRLLGLKPAFSWTSPALTQAEWQKIAASPAVRRIVALHQLGEFALADEELRNWWGRSPEGQWSALLHLAGALDLHGAQLALARRTPGNVTAPMAAHYPVPGWWSAAGPAVPKALVFAFMRQESAFRRDIVSRSNARGLMQFLPATARDVGQNYALSETDPQLNDPTYAITLGKTYLKQLAHSSITNGNLLKIMASYNGGPGHVRRWVGSLPEHDPLLYIESIPLTETRDYVETVMKNFWMYQLQLNEALPTLDAIAAGAMPQFPGMPEKRYAQLSTAREAANAN